MLRKIAGPSLALLSLVSAPVSASQTSCTFAADKAEADYYELEFIGYTGADPMVVFSSTAFGSGARITLDAADYELPHFNQQTRSVTLEFRNPNDPALPPSFTLSSAGGSAQLTIGPNTIKGVVRCDY